MAKSHYSRKALNNIISSIENVKKVQTVEDMFLSDLTATIEKIDYDNQLPPSQTYKPSGMNCMRSCFYAVSGFPIAKEVKSSSVCGICESGTDRHIRIQTVLESMKSNGFDLEYIDVETYINTHNLSDKLIVKEKVGMETKLYMPSLNMSFLTDGIIKYKGIYYIFEFKTEIPNKFYKRDGVDESHISQGTAYSCAFDIPEVIFLYENRATCEHKCYKLSVTEEMKSNRIYNFISSCNEYVSNNMVPPMPTDPYILKKCKYCSYKSLCASHGLGTKVLEGKYGR